jgi:hypothetical protein
MITKEDLLKIAYWTNGCMFYIFCPVLKSKVEFDTYLSHKNEITSRVINTLNEFLSIPEDQYNELEQFIIETYNSQRSYNYPTKFEEIISDCKIDKTNFLNHFIKNEWIQIELLWDDIEKFENNYVNVGFYYPTDRFATYVVYENGRLKTAFIHNGENEYPSKIYK